MELAIPAFVAGLLTILAPCVLPLLPVIVGGTLTGKKHKLTPVVITASLAVSVILFTLLIRASTLLIDIPNDAWAYLSGGIIMILGLVMVWPALWERFSVRLNIASNKLLGKSSQKKGWGGTILMGAALGPVFTSCSPTYSFILFSILPKSKIEGFILLVIYAIGLSLMLLAVAYLGQRFTDKLTKLSDPNSWFKRGIGIMFLLVGLAVLTGFDKTVETWLIDIGIYDSIANFEYDLIDN